ncbi:MAG: hypothetical protein OEM23_03075 [Gemmatimonadota bacterium]|nr:hypothetical protein [Gemmatimonadota bacterium]MDH3427394.1 hypothetical protein [Gemmatimonadota bacterium]
MALVGLLPLVTPMVARAQFAVHPVIVQVAASDEAADAIIQIDNESDDPMQFRIYLMDFDQHPNGDHAFAEPGTAPRSCARRVDVAPGALMVPPGERGLVQVRLRPESGATTCWSMVFVETPSTSATGIRINQRIGVKLYGLSRNAGPEGTLTLAEASHAGDSVDVRFRFSNPGDWPVRPAGAVEIRDLTGSVVTTVPVPSFSVLPLRERMVRVSVPAAELADGRYLAVPILDFGAEFLAGAQVDFRLGD